MTSLWWGLRMGQTMAGWYFRRMLFLLQLAAYMLAYDDTDQIDECNVCQTPLMQNPHVPWHHLLKNTTHYFGGLKCRKMIRVLPSNSFVSGNNIQVCVGKSRCMSWIILLGFALGFPYVYASAKNHNNPPPKVLSLSQKSLISIAQNISPLNLQDISFMMFSWSLCRCWIILVKDDCIMWHIIYPYLTHWGRDKMATVF